MGELGQPHDHFFKLLLDDPASAGALLRERLPPEIAARLSDDPPELVVGSLIDSALQGSESDRVFRARLLDGGVLFIYCLIEHQSTPDPRMPLRLLGYLLRLYEHLAGDEKAPRLPPIIPMVVYHGAAPWTVPLAFSGMLATTDKAVLRHCLDFCYTLFDLGDVSDPELSQQLRLRLGLMALKYATRLREQLAALDQILALAAQVPEMQWPLRVYMIDTFTEMDEVVLDAAWSKHMPKLDVENASKIAKKWFAEGEVKGEVKGEAKALLRLLGRRFGEVPAHYQDAIKAASIEVLDVWLDRAIDAPSLEAVFSLPTH